MCFLSIVIKVFLNNNDGALCADRWKLEYFVQNHRVYNKNEFEDQQESTSVEFAEHISSKGSQSRVLTEQEKYRKAFKVAQSLRRSLCVEICGVLVCGTRKKLDIKEKNDGMTV